MDGHLWTSRLQHYPEFNLTSRRHCTNSRTRTRTRCHHNLTFPANYEAPARSNISLIPTDVFPQSFFLDIWRDLLQWLRVDAARWMWLVMKLCPYCFHVQTCPRDGFNILKIDSRTPRPHFLLGYLSFPFSFRLLIPYSSFLSFFLIPHLHLHPSSPSHPLPPPPTS